MQSFFSEMMIGRFGSICSTGTPQLRRKKKEWEK